MKRARVLVSQRRVEPFGGDSLVAAWTLEALRDEYEVTLATLEPVDCAAINRSFGTSLSEGDFRVRIAPESYRMTPRLLPSRGALMQLSVAMRWARALDAEGAFDVLLGMENEADFGRPGIQYVHYPWYYLPRPAAEMNWYHWIPGFLRLYRALCQRAGGITTEGLRRNRFLANSQFVAGRIRAAHGVDAEVVYPPAPGVFPDIPWEGRRAAVVAMGRMHGIKRWEMAVEAVELLRADHPGVELTLIAASADPDCGRRMAELAARRPWFRILSDVSRAELLNEVASHRYGIHTMEDEHFGVAPAEQLRAGCIPFVHDSGGPVEIVGARRELRFSDARDAAGKLAAVMGNAELEKELRGALARRRNLYSTGEFMEKMRRAVRDSAPNTTV